MTHIIDMMKKPTTAVAAIEPTSITPHRLSYARIVQNFLLIWLDSSIDEANDNDCRKIITELRQVINTVNTFTDVDECIDFITDIKKEKIFLILSEAFFQTKVPVIHEMPQISFIYIFHRNKVQPEQWEKQWFKVK